jgi:patatin-related protein
MTALATPNVDYKKEIRFAVVMYGGVSLAIYINGVAQELLRLVKSTAPSPDSDHVARNLEIKNGKPCGTEAVYRKLSYLIDDPANRASFREALAADKNAASTWQPNDDLHVRFMVDVLAGTSAGGINSIYLAKALANDQNIDELKNLWVTEGDIHMLINDGKSLKNTSLDRQKPPHSLLNSRRMYLKLLAALHGMDAKGKEKRSPLVDELDLYITATDIRGLALPIRLADAVVFERRHRNVFHFKFATANATGNDVNEFRKELNPFLAFAARTTSSFPFAFEPVRLTDIRDLLDHSEEYRADKDKFKPDSPLIRRFFQDNLTQDVEFGSINYDLRSFADGGYLDNKPFSYATSTLMRRTPTVPVDRKLIYVEPSPEHPEREVQPNDPPDAIQNVLAALDLPRYETIRDDIQLVLQRNRLIERVNRLTRLIERDIEDFEVRQGLSSSARAVLETEEEQKRIEGMMRPVRPELTPKLWDAMQLSDMVGLYGLHYLPYRRLRIAALTDEIATLTARVAGFDERSDLFLAIRALVQTWRDETYSDNAPENGNTLNRFLNRFDLAYRLRRLNFLVAKIDELLCLLDRHAKEDIFKSTAAKRLIGRLEHADPAGFNFVALTAEERTQAAKFLLYLKCELNQLFIELRKFGRDLRRPQAKGSAVTAESKIVNPQSEGEKRYQAILEFKGRIQQLGITAEHLELILGADSNGKAIDIGSSVDCLQPDDAALRARNLWDNSADYGVPDLEKRFAAAGESLNALLSSVLGPSRVRTQQLLKPGAETYEPNALCARLEGANYSSSAFAVSARAYLWEYFKHFDDYDQISFPIYFETDVGESDVVEVIRVSPEDAPSLINEKTDARGRKKLAGTKLGNFSAFLDAAWRVNDIMWGRLDGAERLIKSLLPDEQDQDIRDALTREAHQTILAEELSPAAQADLANLLGQALVQRRAGVSVSDAIDKILKPVDNEVVKQRLTSVMTTCLQGDELYTFIRDHYEVNRGFEPEPTLRVLGRATRVIGSILDDISKKNNVETKSTKWISRVGQIFLGLVEVAVPDSLASLLFRHWLKLLYAFEVVLLVLATFVISTPSVANFAWKLLALTLATNFAVLLLRDYMRGKNRWIRIGKLTAAAVVIALVLIGVQDLRGKNWSGKVVGAWHFVTKSVASVSAKVRKAI